MLTVYAYGVYMSSPARKRAANKKPKPLSRARVVQAGLTLVDRGGIDALSMRTVASQLGVEAMSLYRHVSGKQDLLLGIADLVLSKVEVPPPGTPWRDAMRRRALSLRDVFLQHPSGAILVESCVTMTPSRLRYCDAIIGLLCADGFDATLAYRAFLALDSYIYGFAMQELGWPRPTSSARGPAPAEVPSDHYPHFSNVMRVAMSRVESQGYLESYAEEFCFGLDLLLDAFERRRGGLK